MDKDRNGIPSIRVVHINIVHSAFTNENAVWVSYKPPLVLTITEMETSFTSGHQRLRHDVAKENSWSGRISHDPCKRRTLQFSVQWVLL
jgi:hypothetical protein